MLQRGHGGVQLDVEAWDRLITWIDLNGPCHGTWGDVYPIPDGAHERRMALRRAYGGPADDPEAIPDRPCYDETPVEPALVSATASVQAALSVESAGDLAERIVDLGNGVTLKLVAIPGGAAGEPFWMAAYEVTNRQFALFDPDHDAGYYQKRHARSDDQGLPLDGPSQPVVRVSWDRAMDFCRWLSDRTGMVFALPTEGQWEHACRAGTITPLFYGGPDDDFSPWANMGDLAFAGLATEQKRLAWEKGKAPQVTGGLEHMAMEGAALADRRFNDGAVVTTPVGRYRPNARGLYDMHGNAAEWTRTPDAAGRKIVKGGSFFEPPRYCRTALRVAYPAWQRVFNVGFRVVCERRDVTQMARCSDGKR
jgi:formylglycine-generating enzyme required for sulfatase activity